jgi:flavin-dependent dehydrogenase
MVYDVIIIGAGVTGATFASKIVKYANTLLIDTHKDLNSLPVRVNLMPEHNKPFMKDININWSDQSLFPHKHQRSNYLGENTDGIIDSKEFGDPLGHVMHTENVIRDMLLNFEKEGGTLKFNERVTKISKSPNQVKVKVNTGNEYSGKLLAFATGTHSHDLIQSLGFKIPDEFMGIYVNLTGDEDLINENLDVEYIYHINVNISDSGPFFINKARERISTGFLGSFKEKPEEIISKLNNILNNYKRIQPFIKGLKREGDPVIAKTSKHPVKDFSQDRVLLLGECAGLITSFFYEGNLPAVASADIATKTIKPLLEKDSNFTSAELNPYDQEIKRVLLMKYFKNGVASEYIFYSSGTYMKLLWETYAKLIKTNEKLRRYICEAYRTHDIANYDVSRDRWVGQLVFRKLPPLTALALGPKFLKALFKL